MKQEKMQKFRAFIAILLLLLVWTSGRAQQYTATEGLLHVPSADMDKKFTARVGIHYMPKSLVPDMMTVDGEKFNTFSYYISLTPLDWIQVSFVEVSWKFHQDLIPSNPIKFYSKDRHLSIKLRPIKEGRYWPSVAVGADDFWGRKDNGYSESNYFRNYYLALTKHFDIGGNSLGTHLTYRKWEWDFNHRYEGVVGGLTFQPRFYKPLRVIAEWDGCEMNIGADCRLFNLVQLQMFLQDCRYFSGGVCLAIKLM